MMVAWTRVVAVETDRSGQIQDRFLKAGLLKCAIYYYYYIIVVKYM